MPVHAHSNVEALTRPSCLLRSYSLLHDLRLELTLTEVVDVAFGIVSGLQVCTIRFTSAALVCPSHPSSSQYLHEHDPQIIHRDVSSKNILIDGSRCVCDSNLFGSCVGQLRIHDAPE